VACLEEIAYRMGWIDLSMLESLGKEMSKNSYGQYILDLVREERGG